MYISREQTVASMSPNNTPVITVESGDTITFQTCDCYNGLIKSEKHLDSSVPINEINLASGPAFVKTARPGDILKVEILDVQIADRGVMVTVPGKGILKNYIKKETTKFIPIKNNLAIFDGIKLPISPMIGVIGTSPKLKEILNSTPGSHGSNMDCKRIKKGAKVYLPVNVEGALLALGDLHALMGDGESVICGLEVQGVVKVKVTIIKNEKLPLPFVVEGQEVMTISSARTIDEAAKNATIQMYSYLVEQLNIDDKDAGLLLSLSGNLKICQAVNPLKTVRMEFPIVILSQYLKEHGRTPRLQ